MVLVYLVIGRTGEYEDYCEWIAKAYFDFNKANEFMKKCNEYSKGELTQTKDEETGYLIPNNHTEEWCKAHPDNNYVSDYTSSSYTIKKIEVED